MFCVADVRIYDLHIKYDAVISLFHVMSYQVSNEDILAVFHLALVYYLQWSNFGKYYAWR
ncbi:hypothetical protein C804_04115 [Lachnospiraceae bacterium A4]|nr:hypothetical protein C804_04115 [Lachnospiraceae bacterium A4]